MTVWLLILLCACAQPAERHFPNRDACEQAARSALYDIRINVPSYRCEERP